MEQGVERRYESWSGTEGHPAIDPYQKVLPHCQVLSMGEIATTHTTSRDITRHHATSRDTLHQLQHTCAQVKVGGAGYLQKFLETLVVHLPMPVMAQSLIADPAGDLVI